LIAKSRQVRHEEYGVRQIYKYQEQAKPLDLDTQREILRQGRLGYAPAFIATQLRLKPKQVELVIDRGVVFQEALTEPVNCKCGMYLVAVPCLRCELNAMRSEPERKMDNA
jgi:cytochrome c-type biogenesis protein CcmH/NrfG